MQEKEHLEQCQMLYVNLISVGSCDQSMSDGENVDLSSRSLSVMDYFQRLKAKSLT